MRRQDVAWPNRRRRRAGPTLPSPVFVPMRFSPITTRMPAADRRRATVVVVPSIVVVAAEVVT